uniref:Macro domain-containing protein n=1 Tax=Petromyzon marinus TaxID=7757 RepID=S4R8K5_PETMA
MFVHEDDILNLNVDVIVNAANANLNHLGGLAKVLSDAGGTVIQQESDSYVRKHGKVPTGELAITGPGHLPCKKVFHAVGPAWGDYRHNTSVGIFLLRKVITNALKKADEEGFKSIAIPAISAGIFSFPLDICSKEIWHAIFEYCKMTHDCPKTLTDIHIVDINDEFIYKLRKTIELTMNRKDRSEEQSTLNSICSPEKVLENSIFLWWGSLSTKKIIINVLLNPIVNSSQCCMRIIDPGGMIGNTMFESNLTQHQQDTSMYGMEYIVCTLLRIEWWPNSKQHCITSQAPQPFTAPLTILQSVDKMTLDCLKKAHKEKVTSISFPALGTGNLNCPPQQVARAMLSAAIQFNKEHKDEILQLIQFVILRSKPDIFKAFENEISSSISDSEARAPNLKQEERFQTGAEHNKKLFKIQGITVELCSGDITQEKTDAIVNSTDTSMSVTSGISSAILKAAGHTIRDEFSKAEHPKLGDIVVTTAGQLECKYILHIAGLQGNIEQTCSRILHECQKKNIKSVSFPAFGTGNANLSPRNVASGMLNAIHAFAKENKPTIVTNIRIVFVENSLLNVF